MRDGHSITELEEAEKSTHLEEGELHVDETLTTTRTWVCECGETFDNEESATDHVAPPRYVKAYITLPNHEVLTFNKERQYVDVAETNGTVDRCKVQIEQPDGWTSTTAMTNDNWNFLRIWYQRE
jgi:hypothetical protein